MWVDGFEKELRTTIFKSPKDVLVLNVSIESLYTDSYKVQVF